MELASRPTSLSNSNVSAWLRARSKQARILDGRGQAAREQDENFLLLVREVIDLRALDIEHADHLVLEEQRHGHFGAHRIDGIDVARIRAHVGDANGLARGRGDPGDALADRNPPVVGHFTAVADGKTVGKRLRLLIQQHDAKYLVIDEPLDQRGGLRQHLVEVQRGVDLLADLGQRGQNVIGQLLRRSCFDRFHRRMCAGRLVSYLKTAAPRGTVKIRMTKYSSSAVRANGSKDLVHRCYRDERGNKRPARAIRCETRSKKRT